ncbi:hypothetical protein OPQ81_008799 [Rhizoctonia solani]|nr:hypothetical protein OPQ81_008799 [Rhizoctonia solani]
MNISVAKPDDIELELLESQGGNISPDHFGELLARLKKSRSLDHAGQPILGNTLGELDIIYVVLHKGYVYELDENGDPKYTCVMKGVTDYWLAGFGSLRISQARNSDKNTADITISLLPQAQKMVYECFLVQRLVQHAFDALHIHRVTASIVCPIQPYYTAVKKKQVLFNTKQLCSAFEKFGFTFEGVTRGAIKSSTKAENEDHVWHDVHRMSMLNTDYFEGGRWHILSNTRAFQEKNPKSMNSWERMVQRQEEEKRDLELWVVNPSSKNMVMENDIYEEEERSDDETVLGDDDDNEWQIPDDFRGLALWNMWIRSKPITLCIYSKNC